MTTVSIPLPPTLLLPAFSLFVVACEGQCVLGRQGAPNAARGLREGVIRANARTQWRLHDGGLAVVFFTRSRGVLYGAALAVSLLVATFAGPARADGLSATAAPQADSEHAGGTVTKATQAPDIDAPADTARVPAVRVRLAESAHANPPPVLHAVQRPARLAAGVTFLAVGTGIWIGTGFAIASTGSVCSRPQGAFAILGGLDCSLDTIGDVFLGAVATGFLAGGVSLTVTSFEPADPSPPHQGDPWPEAKPSVSLGVSPTGLVLQGSF